MAAQRLYHPEHGYHHAYDGAEVKRLKEFGWVIQSEKEFQAVLAAKKAAAVEVSDEPEVQEAPRKLGRPRKEA